MSALSHYSCLNPDEQICYAFDSVTFKALDLNDIKGLNTQDGPVVLEIWRYPPLVPSGNTEKRYVDKLSLYLSLRNEKDPRIEKELEIMLKSMEL